MSYKKDYLHLFKRLTEIAELLESTDIEKEYVEVGMLIKQLQAEGEEIIIAEK